MGILAPQFDTDISAASTAYSAVGDNAVEVLAAEKFRLNLKRSSLIPIEVDIIAEVGFLSFRNVVPLV
jgi:hypothetical protein